MADSLEIANQARLAVLEMIHRGQTSHIGSNLSVIDLLAVLQTEKTEHDRIIVSKGWAAASAYFFLSNRESIDQFPKQPYIGLLEPNAQGIQAMTGSAGHGLPVAIGKAIALKKQGKEGIVYCIMSDGEMDCGTTWESALIASHHNLDNLTVIIDANGFQAMGPVKEVLNIEPLPEKFRSFGWNTYEILGHDHREIAMVLDMQSDRPKCIIARTIKGKGVKHMEGQLSYHYLKVTDEDYEKAKNDINGTA